jgi:hypothetical protein
MGWMMRQIRPVSFNYRDGPQKMQKRLGFIAQELEEVVPQVTREQGEGSAKTKSVMYMDLIAVLTSMIQELGENLAFMRPRVLAVERRVRQRKKKIRAKRKRKALKTAK